jgi:thiol:disulfide interchange protein DsbD
LLASASYFYVANQNHAAEKNQPRGFWYGFRSLIIFLMLFLGANIAYQTLLPSPHKVEEVTGHPTFKQVISLAELNSEIAKANNQGKTVMLDLYADWCKACIEFEKYTFVDIEVQKALSNSVWLQIDMTEFDSSTNTKIVEHFTIFGLPSILFFDLQGNELTKQRTTGFMNANDFTAHVKSFFNE